jgi:hypothetical protein
MGKGSGDPDGARQGFLGRQSVDASDDVRPEPDREHDGAEMIRSSWTAARHAISRP